MITVLLLIVVATASVIVSLGWNNATDDSRNEIVFEERNQAYGAYEMRKNYNKRVVFVLLGVFLFSVALWGIKSFVDNRPEETEPPIDYANIKVDITPPPPAEEIPPPPPPPPPPPMVEMVKFVPPVIKDDAVEEEPQKLQEEVKDTNVGTKDQEGEKDVVAPPSDGGNGPAEPAAPEIFTVVEEMPEFPGGIGEMGKFIQKTLVYPTMAREAGIAGKCFLKFVVDGGGKISDVTVLKGVPGCPECDKEAIRVVKEMPAWKGGKQNGRPVNVYYNLPINFKIK
jgi:periplasmic protein TonB